jgi:hypothetical protein
MQNYKLVLLKCLTLLYRQSLMEVTDSNNDLVKTILDTISTEGPDLNFNGHNEIKELKNFCSEILASKEDLNKELLLQRLKFTLQNDEKLYTAIEQGIEPEYEDGTNKRVIISLVKYLTNYYKEHVITTVINKASYDIKFNRSKIGNMFEYVAGVMTQLEPLSTNTSIKDPALVGEIDFVNEDSVSAVFSEIKKSATGSVIFKTGWHAFNRMLQGGFRRGEFTMLSALQHKYKTGFTLSTFMQIALHNTPTVAVEGKKPLLLRISFEDSLNNNVQFMYQYLRCHDEKPFEQSELSLVPPAEMSQYIIRRLTVNGFHIKMMRIDPTQWGYKDLCNKVIELEALGYDVQLAMVDYLALVPTTGCTMGAVGMDRRDQFRRVRAFFSAKNIAFVTPHQLSTESKNIIRQGIVPECNFVKEISEKGYFDGCKTLDQEVDLELYIHLFHHKRKAYLSVQRGKHRLPTQVDPEDKYFLLPFTNKNMPILEDPDGHDNSLRALPRDNDSSSGSHILEEMLR